MQDENNHRPVFVTRHTAAALMQIWVDSFDTWVRSGYVPRATINRGQIIRWHWPSLEERLVELAKGPPIDPSIVDPTRPYIPRRRGPKKRTPEPAK